MTARTQGRTGMLLTVLLLGVALTGQATSLYAGFIPTDLAGLGLWLDAGDPAGTGTPPASGTNITTWSDKSGNARHANQVNSDPQYQANVLNGRAVINFDGDDWIRTTANLDSLTNYSIFTVARYANPGVAADSERVISSTGRNWLFGFHGQLINRWHAEGWIYPAGGTGGVAANNQWYEHAGTIGPATSNPPAAFWSNGTLLTTGNYGSGDANYMISQLQLGGWNGATETSAADVAEVVIYNSVLTGAQMNQVGFYLTQKYGLSTTYPAYAPDTTRVWDGTVNAWGDAAHWSGGAVPNADTGAQVDAGQVTLSANGTAYWLDHNGGTVIVGSGTTLNPIWGVDSSGTSNLQMNNNSALTTRSGNIVRLDTYGSATLTTTQAGMDLSIARLDDHDTAGTLTKLGPGRVVLDNTAGLNNSGDTTFRVNAGTLSVTGATPLGGAQAILDGGTLEVIGAITITPGLLEGRIANVFNETTPNPGGAYTLGVRMGQLSAKPPWGDNETWVYTGQFYDADGVCSFGENIDDYSKVVIDGVQRQRDTQWNVPTTTGVMILGVGPYGNNWHDIEIRLGNGTGGAGAVAGNGWTATYGFGYAINGTTSNQGTAYVAPQDPGDASFFRYATYSAIDMTGTNVSVLSNSAINAISNLSAAFGALSIANGATLTTSGATTTFTSLAFTGPSGRTAGISNSNLVTIPTLNDGGVPTLFTKGGAGNLSLASVTVGDGSVVAVNASTLTLQTVSATDGAVFRANGGTLIARNPSLLGNADNLVLAGGTFQPDGGGAAVGLSGTDVRVITGTTTSVINPTNTGAGVATFRNLTLEANSTLTLSGSRSNFAITDFLAGSSLVISNTSDGLGTARTSGNANIGGTGRAEPTTYTDQGIA
ncbi:MAG: LamG domain-containing protein, partial [Planctomycetes bacterium]|nr:LamG domain-containing protein [Planctomycetota bacterium]